MDQTTQTLTVTDGMTGRIDKELGHHFPQFSRSQLKRWIDDGTVTVNGQTVKAKYQLQAGDRVVIEPETPVEIDLEPENISLDIVYEDDDVLVVNKPQGMVVHPAPGHPNHTLVNALMYHAPLSSINGELRPGIVHRIDKDTSGLLMVAKTNRAHRSLTAQLKEKSNLREYVALVHGVIKENEGTIDAPLARSPKDRKKQAVVGGGRPPGTPFPGLKRYQHYTPGGCRPGNRANHPNSGDIEKIHPPPGGEPPYRAPKTLPGHGQYLHARLLGFEHPVTGEEMVFTAPLPDYFEQMLSYLDRTDA